MTITNFQPIQYKTITIIIIIAIFILNFKNNLLITKYITINNITIIQFQTIIISKKYNYHNNFNFYYTKQYNYHSILNNYNF